MTRTTSAPRLGRGLAAAAAALAAVAAVALTATPAHASVVVAPSTGLNAGAGGASVTVSGSAPASASSATTVTLAVCNVAAGVIPGSRCDALNASGFETIADYNSGITFQVYKTFADYTFLGGAGPVAVPGSSTTCLGSSGSQCALVVSYYNGSGGGATQLGAELYPITFN